MDKKERKSVERLLSSLQDETGKKSIEIFLNKLKNYPKDDFEIEEAKDLLHSMLDELEGGPGKIFMPLRAVMTGQARGADLYNILYIIGKDRAIKRMETTIKKYNIL